MRGRAGRGGTTSNPVCKAFHGKGAGKARRNVGRAAWAAAVAGVAAARWAKESGEESE